MANWYAIENRLGVTNLQGTDSTNVDNTTVNNRYPVGTIVRGQDATYGMGEFIYLPGVANLAVGTLVQYESYPSTGVVTVNPVTANLGGPVAISMAANTSASSFSWFQIAGAATVLKNTGVAFTGPQLAVFQDVTAGQVSATASAGKQVLNATTAATAATAATYAILQIDRPFMQGQIT